jgi:hypothetical protein
MSQDHLGHDFKWYSVTAWHELWSVSSAIHVALDDESDTRRGKVMENSSGLGYDRADEGQGRFH